MTAVAVTRPARSGVGRTVIGSLLMVLCGVLIVTSVSARWTRSAILDTDTWRATSRAIVTDPAVQKEVADDISAQIVKVVGVQAFLGQVLPGGLSALSGTATDLATQALSKAMQQVVTTDVFLDVWDTAVDAAHTQFVDAVKGDEGITVVGDGGVYLDLGAVVGVVQKFLSSKGIDWLKSVDPNSIDVRILLVDAPGLQRAKDLVSVLDVLVWVLPIAAIAALVLGLLVARRRLVALAAGGVGLVIGSLVVWAIASVGRSRAIDELTGGLLGRASARVIVDEVMASLDHRLVIAGVVGAVLAIAMIAVSVVLGRRSGGGSDLPPSAPEAPAPPAPGGGFSTAMPASPPTMPTAP